MISDIVTDRGSYRLYRAALGRLWDGISQPGHWSVAPLYIEDISGSTVLV